MIQREDEFSEKLNKGANFSGFTPLHYAALTNSYECVLLLLKAGIALHNAPYKFA